MTIIKELEKKVKELQEENKWLASMLDGAILDSENKEV